MVFAHTACVGRRLVALSGHREESSVIVRPIRVAVVDDNDDIRLLVAMHLTLDDRFELAGEAADGGEAIALLGRSDIDVMVLDMHMPEIGGRQVLEAWRRAHSPIRVVAFSADPQMLVEAARDGAAATVLKGDSLDDLLNALVAMPAVA
jgi:DNA-binding NarL/FixJ family response regulator